MAKRTAPKKQRDTANLGFEEKLWLTADKDSDAEVRDDGYDKEYVLELARLEKKNFANLASLGFASKEPA